MKLKIQASEKTKRVDFLKNRFHTSECTQAPSTRIRIFLKTHLFLSVLGSRPHGDGVFSHRKRSFSKTLSRVDLCENAVFMLSCGRVKTELFENADVKASIYDVSEHAHGSLGTTKGHFDCLFPFVEVRTAKFECSSVFVWTGIFSKTLLVWTRISLKTDKKRCVFKNIWIRVDEASVFSQIKVNKENKILWFTLS